MEVNQKSLQMLFELIDKPRKSVEVIPTTGYKWGLIRPEHLLRTDVSESQLDNLIPLHDCVQIN